MQLSAIRQRPQPLRPSPVGTYYELLGSAGALYETRVWSLSPRLRRNAEHFAPCDDGRWTKILLAPA